MVWKAGRRKTGKKRREMKNIAAVTCSVQLQSSCVLSDKETLLLVSFLFPRSCSQTFTRSEASQRTEGAYTDFKKKKKNTMMHKEDNSMFADSLLTTGMWVQALCFHAHTHSETEADRSEGLWHVTAVQSNHRLQLLREMKGREGRRAALRRNRNKTRRKTPAESHRATLASH